MHAVLEASGYICSPVIATIVFLAKATQKPVLVEGPAGVGKTELAKAVARPSVLVSLEYGTRATTDNSLVRDKIFRLGVGLNFSELWFVRYEEE